MVTDRRLHTRLFLCIVLQVMLRDLTWFALLHQSYNYWFVLFYLAVFYQQQQPKPQQPEQQQPQQPQQVPVTTPTKAQPRESSGSSRRARSSALRLVVPNTNRDVLTGEEVLVSTSVVVTPTTSTPPELVFSPK
jgi:hypothetical protein